MSISCEAELWPHSGPSAFTVIISECDDMNKLFIISACSHAEVESDHRLTFWLLKLCVRLED